MSNNVSSKGSDKGAQATGVGIVVVLILPVAIDERQFTASCRLFFPLRAADIRLWVDPFVAHIKHKLDNITALLRSNVCVKVSAFRCTLIHRRRLKQVYSWMLAISAQPWHTHTHAQFGHFRVRLCDLPTQAWQRMSGRLSAIAHLRRENRRRY